MKRRCSSIAVVSLILFMAVTAKRENQITEPVEQIEVPKLVLATHEVSNVRIVGTPEPVPYEVTAENLVEEFYCDSLELLALVVEAEAGNQSELGKRLVVDVVLNRVDSEDFPDTIWEVLTQKNAFSSYWDGGVEKVQSPATSTYAAVEAELNNRTNFSVLYFTSEGFSRYGTAWEKVGDHYFSTK